MGLLGALLTLSSFVTHLAQGSIVYSTAMSAEAVSTAVVRVNYVFLAPLIAQLALSCVFLAAIAVWTRVEGVQIIKSSSVATLVALDEESRACLGSLAEFGIAGARAERMSVRLEKNQTSGLATGLVSAGSGGGPGKFEGGMTAVRLVKYEQEKSKMEQAKVYGHGHGA